MLLKVDIQGLAFDFYLSWYTLTCVLVSRTNIPTNIFILSDYHISIEHQRHYTQFVFSIEIVMLHVPSVII